MSRAPSPKTAPASDPTTAAPVRVREIKQDQERFPWIIQIVEHPRLPPNAARICVVFAFGYFEIETKKGVRQQKPFFPSHATVARRLALKEDTVQGIVAALAREGFLKKWKAFGSSNRYVLCFPIPDENPGLDGTPIPDENPGLDPDKNPVLDPDADPQLASNRDRAEKRSPIPDENPAQSRINIRGTSTSYLSGGDPKKDHPPHTMVETIYSRSKNGDEIAPIKGAPDGRLEDVSPDGNKKTGMDLADSDNSPSAPSQLSLLNDLDVDDRDDDHHVDGPRQLTEEEERQRRDWEENFNDHSYDY